MNGGLFWYKLFYWITVAERVQNFILTMAVCMTIGLAISGIVYWVYKVRAIASGYQVEENKTYARWARNAFRVFIPLFFVFWFLEIAVPSKSDTVLILAGGAVGQFVTSDSSAKKLPSDITMFLHEKIGELTKEAKSDIAPSDAQKNLKNLDKLDHDAMMDKLKNLPDSILEKIK